MNPHTTASGLRLTPSNSPFFRSSSPRSPTKSNIGNSNSGSRGGDQHEAGLRLQKVIGTTASSANGFDCVPATRQFAYTAGAAAVVATVAQDLTVAQRFFRARPSLAGAALRDWLLSPGTPGESRNVRASGLVRDLPGVNASPWASSTPGREWLDSPTGGRGSFVGGSGGGAGGAKDRVKAATSVALSPNGKWIAMGESGYRPRVLLFSNAEASSELPVVALAEHSFGVRALAFSPDSRFLASLGTVNDGFLYIWAIDDRTGLASLHSSNKCTAMINVVTWIGRSLLTAGLRFVKVWRPDEDLPSSASSSTTTLSPLRPADSTSNNKPTGYQKQKVLNGKNCLLGDLIDANFTTATPIGGERAIVCAETGEICLLDEAASSQSLRALEKVDFSISAATLDHNGALRVAGPAGCERTFDIDALVKGTLSSPSKRRQTSIASRAMSISDTSAAVALATIDDITVELDSHRGVRLSRSDADGEVANDNNVLSHQLPAHNDTVLGVKPFTSPSLPSAAFLTFSTNGSVRIWDAEGCSCAALDVPIETSPEMYDLPNELKAAAPIDNGARIAAGDRYGTLSILDVASNSVVARVRAHSAEVVDLIAFERGGTQLIVTGSRDRMIQLFLWRREERRLELLQTMDEHAGAVNGLLTAAQGEMLLSCSADRTIVVREAMVRRGTSFSSTTTAAAAHITTGATAESDEDPASVAFLILRTISLKSSPASMCLEASEMEILVSTMDRSIAKYNLRTGHSSFNFKCSDSEGGESTAIGKVLYAPSLNGNPTIIGVSSGDKSVRLYSEFGSLMARDWGHTEGIMDVMLLAPASSTSSSSSSSDAVVTAPKLVTVAADSTIFIWNTASPAKTNLSSNNNNNSSDPEGAKDSTQSPILPPSKTLTPMAPPLRKVLSYSELSRHQRSALAREKSLDDSSSPSPNSQTPTAAAAAAPPSPPRLIRKKTSRASLAQPPKLEPAFRSSTFPDGGNAGTTGSVGRRGGGALRRRSPSPPSPRNTNGDTSVGAGSYSSGNNNRRVSRRPSLAPSLRSKSSEGMLSSQYYSSSANLRDGGIGGLGGGGGGGAPPLPAGAAGAVANANAASPSPFGSLTASTEAVCRTLRAYRKKLSNAAATSTSSSSTNNNSSNNNSNANSSSAAAAANNQFTLDSISPDTLRELEKELKLTARVVGEKFLLATGGKPQLLDENAMTKLLDRASERIVGLLDQRIKERLDGAEEEAGGDDGSGSGDGGGGDGGNDDGPGNDDGDGRAVGGGGGTTAAATTTVGGPSARGASTLLANAKSDELIGRDEKVRVLAGALAEVKLGR